MVTKKASLLRAMPLISGSLTWLQNVLRRLFFRGFDDFGFRSVVLDGGDAFLEDGFGRIGFALADDLAVLRLQDEIDFAVGGGLRLELRVNSGVLADGFDAFQGVAFRLVLLAGQPRALPSPCCCCCCCC